jgi:hypothetical protein
MTDSPAGTTTQRPRWRSRLTILLAAAAATIGLAIAPALSASASPAAAKPTVVVVNPAFTPGSYTLYYSWGCTTKYASVVQTFNADGTITAPGTSGHWAVQDGTIMWNYTAGPAIYGGNVDGPAGTGMISQFPPPATYTGCWYMVKVGSTTTTGGPPYEAPGTSTSTGIRPTAHLEHGLG